MCGIAGRYNWRTGAPASRLELERMAAAMSHRGPDGEGYHLDGALGLAHRRLAIIDLAGGAQPMTTPDQDVHISYNGEVFNYVELLDELRARGHQPRTQSDTEAVLLAYREWGLEFASRLNGMFAVAIWDARRRMLVLARDRMGVKPLYVADTPDGVAFASEIKALRCADGIDGALDLDALDEYMALGYVIHPRSMVRGVRKIEPGTVTKFVTGCGEATRTYWSLRFDPDPVPSADEWAERVRTLFDDAVRIRLRSDVPVGVLLSGGVDSTAIAATIAKQGMARGLDTFCIGVDVPGSLVEFDWARAVAERLGTRHHEQRLTEAQYADALVEAAQLLDEPLAEPMEAQLLALCRTVRGTVKVVLSGEGSDETWFGYTAYRTMHAIEQLHRIVPASVLRRIVPLAARLADVVPMSSRGAKYLRLAAEPLERRYLGLNYFDTALKDRMYSEEMRAHVRARGRDAREYVRHLYDAAGGPETISRMAAVDCRAWLVDNTLLRSDLMSMAASVELRVPFMDYRLVELAARVPAGLKVKPHSQKWILKKALEDRLPRDVVRRKKVGFPTPVTQLFKGAWGVRAEEVLLSPSRATEHLFDRAFVKTLLDEHRSGRNDWTRQLFQLLMLEYWADAVPETGAAERVREAG